ncbi:hypothetical protein ABZS29_07690 [Kribbella sp. NPDC005582]|uniref:DUF6932 family protein n=1 Tax=Kribbella sp. NPDC005582 TaxID=3156893 RepID=UPI0033AC3A7B
MARYNDAAAFVTVKAVIRLDERERRGETDSRHRSVGGQMLPELLDNGHLPPGRYATSLPEIEQRFVTHSQFSDSRDRRVIWAGFLDYLEEWQAAQEALGIDVLHSVWLAGSFVSSKLHPSDLDITPVISQGVVDGARGQIGMKRLKKLIGHQAKLMEAYRLDVFPLPWLPVVHPLNTSVQTVAERHYLARRGTYDDFWQRIGPDVPAAPLPPVCHAERGMLEVAV